MIKKTITTLIILSVLLQYPVNFALAASDQTTITLSVGLTADFSGTPTSGTAPLTVSFTDASSGTGAGTTYSWSFGDGGTSTEQNPTYIYTSAGTYTVSLTVTYSGSSDTETKAGYITVTEAVVPPTTGGGGGGGVIPPPVPPIIYDVQIVAEEYSAVISWKTDKEATTEIEWGKTADYEEGTIVAREDDLIIEHEIKIENLEPDTVYHFRIKARSADKGEAVSKDYTFRTLFVDLIPPANVSDFQAIPDDQKITLTWVNPPDEDFAGVKIMRSEIFFPLSPDQGEEIYNGLGEEFTDTGLTNGKRYYYTAFAYDRADNFASGAIATAFPWPKDQPLPEIIPPIIPPGFHVPPEWLPFIPVLPITPIPFEKLTIHDFDFFQNNKQIFPDEQGRLKLTANIPLEVSIKAEKLPYVLKSIIFNIALPQNSQTASLEATIGQPQSASYLLKINQEKGIYQAKITLPRQAGQYDLTLMILNYQDGSIFKITGQLLIRQSLFILPLALQRVPAIYGLLFLIIASLIILLIAYLISRRRKKKREAETELKPQYPELKPD